MSTIDEARWLSDEEAEAARREGKPMATLSDTLPSDLAYFATKRKGERRDVVREETFANGDRFVMSRVLGECFTFTDGEGSEYQFFVLEIKQAIADKQIAFEMMECDVNAELYRHVLKNNGVEESVVAAKTLGDLSNPGLMVFWPSGISAIIDGNHRLCARWRMGIKRMRFAAVMLPHLRESGYVNVRRI